jgi:predicted enzyme related to lactoylglutathione lyase
MALHADHDGEPHRVDAAGVNFRVDDATAVAARIDALGGRITRKPEVADFRPTQPVRAYIGKFADPDGNEHYLLQVTEVLAP